MKKSKKQIMNEYLQDSEDYNDFLKEHGFSQKDYSFKEYCEDVR